MVSKTFYSALINYSTGMKFPYSSLITFSPFALTITINFSPVAELTYEEPSAAFYILIFWIF